MTLKGRTALVTGATGDGMGRSIALTLAREGAAVVLNYRSDSDRARRVVAAVELLGREALPYRADVSDAAEVDALFAAARERFGHVDIVVNSAGGSWKPQDLAQVPPGHFRRVLEEEVFATFLLLRAALPEMRDRGWGRFVSIGGHGADDWRFGPPQAPLDYPLGKAARHWLTRTVAPLEVAHGITVNAVAPGPTPYITLDEALAAVRGQRPEGAGNSPQDVAELVAFLCSDAAARVTGAVIPVPGDKPV
jgi:3-oxoacyl-[acyl-carrier protein] reductase